MFEFAKFLLFSIKSLLKTRTGLILEVTILRHQLNIYKRHNTPKLKNQDRMILIALSRIWNDWKSVLVIVKPETVLQWRRKGFKMYWRWKSRTGRPTINWELSKKSDSALFN